MLQDNVDVPHLTSCYLGSLCDVLVSAVELVRRENV